MPDYDLKSSLGQNARVDRPMTRIDALVAQTKAHTDRVRSATERVVRHAHSLGFFPDTPTAPGQSVAPTPIITTLEDALRDHDQALDELAAALNLFD